MCPLLANTTALNKKHVHEVISHNRLRPAVEKNRKSRTDRMLRESHHPKRRPVCNFGRPSSSPSSPAPPRSEPGGRREPQRRRHHPRTTASAAPARAAPPGPGTRVPRGTPAAPAPPRLPAASPEAGGFSPREASSISRPASSLSSSNHKLSGLCTVVESHRQLRGHRHLHVTVPCTELGLPPPHSGAVSSHHGQPPSLHKSSEKRPS